MSNIKFSCKISTTDPKIPLGLEAWIDGNKFFDTEHLDQRNLTISTDLSDDEAEHVLRFVMKNKQPSHTKVDQDGKIIADACVSIDEISFDDMKLGYMMTKLSTYTHDFNGTGPETQQQFYGQIGCNGTVRLEFSTPIYLWLLAHS